MRPRLRKFRAADPTGTAARHDANERDRQKQRRNTGDPPGDRVPQTTALRAALESIPRILLIRLRSLGDAVLTLPLVEALHAWRPALELDVLVEASYAAVFQGHPHIHEVLTLKPRRANRAEGWSRFRAAVEIRKRRYPAVLNLHGGSTSMLLTALSGAGLKIGQKHHRGSCLYNAPIPPSDEIWRRPSVHTAEHQISLMRWLDLPIAAEIAGLIPVRGDARERVRERRHREGISDYFLIQPTATLATKQWSAAKFAALGDHLFKRHGGRIIYIAAPHEIQVLEKVRTQSEERHAYWSDLPLEDLFALIAECRLFIGNDSGPMHAAAALKKPLVVVWGSSDFEVWHPWNAAYEAVRSNLPCMPCPGYACAAFGEPRCILDITVEQVLEACERMLARTGKDKPAPVDLEEGRK